MPETPPEDEQVGVATTEETPAITRPPGVVEEDPFLQNMPIDDEYDPRQIADDVENVQESEEPEELEEGEEQQVGQNSTIPMAVGSRIYNVGYGPNADIDPEEFQRRLQQSIEDAARARSNRESQQSRPLAEGATSDSLAQLRKRLSDDDLAGESAGALLNLIEQQQETMRRMEGQLADLGGRISPVEHAAEGAALRSSVLTRMRERAPEAEIDPEQVLQSAIMLKQNLADNPGLLMDILADVAVTGNLSARSQQGEKKKKSRKAAVPTQSRSRGSAARRGGSALSSGPGGNFERADPQSNEEMIDALFSGVE